MVNRAYGEVPLVLHSLYIAPYIYSTDTIGSQIALPEQMTFSVDWDTDNPEIKSGGVRRHAASVLIGGTFTLSSAGIPWNALVTMVGWTLNSPSSGVETLRGSLTTTGLPYFAIAGRLLDRYTGDVHIGLVAALLNKPPTWSLNENSEFVISEAEGKIVIPDGRSCPYIEKHQTAAAIDMTTLFA